MATLECDVCLRNTEYKNFLRNYQNLGCLGPIKGFIGKITYF